MRCLRNLPLVAVLALPLLAGATPTITITNPKPSANLTNGVLMATGTVKDTVALTSVAYSFNGRPWAMASGTTNWSVANLALTPGSNSFWAYAVDKKGATSAIAKVSFTYVVDVPLTVALNPPHWGSVNPNYNGQFLQIQKPYTMTAQAAAGFGFAGWTSNGIPITKSTRLSFVMASNLTFAANFADITAPSCSFTYPTAGHTFSNSPINATVRATDNVGVTAVYYQLNGGAWFTNATSADKTNWTLPSLALAPGANTLQAFAVDTATNSSKPSSVSFKYVPPSSLAPASLAGLVGTVVGSTGNSGIEPPFEISFGAATFAQSSTDTNQSAKVGNYTYAFVDTTNTVLMANIAVAPPNKAGQTKSHLFTFTNSATCLFTNEDGSTGYITFAPAANLVPSPSAILTVQHWDTNSTESGTTVFTEGAFTNYSNYATSSQTRTGWGTYSLEPFSPVAAMLQQNFTDPNDLGYTSYIELTFAATNAGAYFSEGYDSSGKETDVRTGGFTILNSSRPPAGYAPMNIVGKTWTVTSGASRKFSASFGTYTYSAFDTNTVDVNTVVGDYAYMKTGPNTAQFVNTDTAPPAGAGGPYTLYLRFTSSTSATWGKTNQDGEVRTGTVSVATAGSYAPTSVAGKTITSSAGGSGTFDTDGTFTFTKNGHSQTSAYTYAQYGPVGGMVVLGRSDGSSTYVQLQFSSASAGSWFQTDFDSAGVFQDVDSGTFTLH